MSGIKRILEEQYEYQKGEIERYQELVDENLNDKLTEKKEEIKDKEIEIKHTKEDDYDDDENMQSELEQLEEELKELIDELTDIENLINERNELKYQIENNHR